MSTLPLFSMNDLLRRGFMGFAPVRNLLETLDIVPRKPGVYAALWARNGLPMFLESDAWWAYDVRNLESRWLEDAQTIYLGKATQLRRRIGQMLRQPINQKNGRRGSHRGGRAIWQISDAEDLVIAWHERDQPEDLEAQLIQEFRGHFDALPFANRQGLSEKPFR